MLQTFSFTLNLDNKEIVYSGNISAQVAAQILQQIIIMEEVKRELESQKAGQKDARVGKINKKEVKP